MVLLARKMDDNKNLILIRMKMLIKFFFPAAIVW